SISITQNSASSNHDYYNVSFALPQFDQDLYIAGDVINETGVVNIVNDDGSITVSGEIRGETINISAAKDFTLNSEDWFHTGRDPRQYFDLTIARNLVYNTSGSLDTETFASAADLALGGGETLQSRLNQPDAVILAQGTIGVTARYLNINGLIQSGAQTVTLTIDESFVPPADGQLIGSNGQPVAGVSFGTERVPVKAHFDFAQNAIVVEDIVPEGGRVILAGQILSTGNGQVKAAYGHASVDIVNNSNYRLITNRIDTTKDRQGKITLIDTARLLDGAGNDETKFEFTFAQGQVVEKRYDGDLVQGVSAGDTPSRIQYTLSQTINHGETAQFAPRAGLQYLWTEGQERVQTTITKYEKNTFNLFGGNTGFEDWLSSDNAYKWKTFEFKDGAPLLESEVLAVNGAGGALETPAYSDLTAYSIQYERLVDADVDVVSGVTSVYYVSPNGGSGGTPGYVYTAQFTGESILPNENFGNTDRWSKSAAPGSEAASTYRSDFLNRTIISEEWETGGGWLSTKTYHTKITEIAGQKDYYTHTLKADYPIAIDFVGSSTSTIHLSSKNDLLIQGDVKVADGGSVSLTSGLGSVLGGEANAIYNDAPDVTAARDARLLVEGGEGVLNVWAGRHIEISTVLDDKDSSLMVDQVVSTGGNTSLRARDGITAADGGALVQGNRVTLTAAGADIEGSGGGALRINSNILGTGGLTALGGGDVRILETEGDLRLLKSATTPGGGSILAAGHVDLATTAGSILDANHELNKPTPAGSALSPEQLRAFNKLNGLAPIDYVYHADGSVTEIFDTDPSNDVTLESFQFPVAPGLYSYLYPHAEFLGAAPTQLTPENMNVVAASVSLRADGGGAVGRSQAPIVVDFTAGFNHLSADEKALLSNAGVSDVYGVQHALYRYIGAGEAGSNLKDQDFGDTARWQKIGYTATGTSKLSPVVRNVAHLGYVLVEFNDGRYGLYQYQGAAGDLNLAAENYANDARWHEVVSRSTQDVSGNDLVNGQLVSDHNQVERVAFQLRDDVDVDIGSDGITAISDGNVALESSGAMYINRIEAVGDIYLRAVDDIVDTGADSEAAVATAGDLSLSSASGSIHGSSPLRMQVGHGGHLYASASGSIDLLQRAADPTINGLLRAVDELYVDNVNAGNAVHIEVEEGNMVVQSVLGGGDSALIAAGSLRDAFADDDAPTVNVNSGNLDLQAGVDIGEAGNFLDVAVSGNVSGQAGGDVYLNSPVD
ncbi:MAG: hypothetical protein OEW36_06520, partial [Hylemonella sp.]|nr:hypothetical protein [Hylemonella sp.]